jgi:hypothetical protein
MQDLYLALQSWVTFSAMRHLAPHPRRRWAQSVFEISSTENPVRVKDGSEGLAGFLVCRSLDAAGNPILGRRNWGRLPKSGRCQ